MTTQLSLLDREWVHEAIPSVLAAIGPGAFTSDDLHGVVPEPDQRNYWGILFSVLHKQGYIERIGSRPSSRPEANGRWVAVWRRVL